MSLKEDLNYLKNSYTIFFISIIFLYITSCGADIDSADEVESMFKDPLSLQEKMNVVCSKISSDSNLSLEGLGAGDKLCSSEPGKHYINLSDITEDSNILSDSGDKGDVNPYSFWTRTELYVDNTILETIQKSSSTLKDLTSTNSSNKDFQISMIDKVKIDDQNLSVTASFNISSSTSKAPINNNWTLYGTKVDNYMIASIQTRESNNLQNPSYPSILESAKIFVVVIPHAGEVYIDLLTQFNLDNSSEMYKIMKQEIIRMLTKTLYDIKQTLN